jgi:hypothetical protein
MSDPYLPYVHVLLFRCKICNMPVPISVTSEARNHENVDAGFFDVHCSCGWKKQSLGIEAVNHWVAQWEVIMGVEDLRQLEAGQ